MQIKEPTNGKQKIEEPKIEIIKFPAEDILTSSTEEWTEGWY